MLRRPVFHPGTGVNVLVLQSPRIIYKKTFGSDNMKVTVFNGSPAGANSATSVIANAWFLKGAASAGAETETFFLKGLSGHPLPGLLFLLVPDPWTVYPPRMIWSFC